jgi:hypothetical protein
VGESTDAFTAAAPGFAWSGSVATPAAGIAAGEFGTPMVPGVSDAGGSLFVPDASCKANASGAANVANSAQIGAASTLAPSPSHSVSPIESVVIGKFHAVRPIVSLPLGVRSAECRLNIEGVVSAFSTADRLELDRRDPKTVSNHKPQATSN